jgi:serine/threonine protein kinase
MGFYGCELKEKDVFIFMEYCPNGMLTKLIDNGIEE